MRRLARSIIVLFIAAAGCGGNPTASDAPGDSSAAQADIKKRDLESLPAVDDYGPPVDDGRLEVAPPAGWNLLPRGRTYLIGFSKGKANELPRIVVNAQEPHAGTPGELTPENAAQFAAQQDAELRSPTGARKKVEEYNLPIILGETTFVRHVRQASLGGAPCAVQSLQTVRGGRLYTVELIVEIDAPRAEDYEASLTKWRDYGYAVAGHLKFAEPGEKLDAVESNKAAQPAKSDSKSEKKKE